jgi:hypothetical protein
MEKGNFYRTINLFVIEKKRSKDQWPEFKENYYNDKGVEYDKVIDLIV